MKQIADIIAYIEENLDSDISVESVATHSGYSTYHFQRLFTQCVGVTMGTYINRRRLTKAAQFLATTDRRIIDIAQEAGFNSQEAFTRAFSVIFKKTPARYRKDKDEPVLKAFPIFTKDFVHHLSTHKELATPRFVKRDSFTLIGLSEKVHRGKTETIATHLWPTFLARFDEIQNKLNSDVNYGLLKDGGAVDGPQSNRFTYIAAVEVEPNTKPPLGMERFDIVAQSYAVFDHKGTLNTLCITNQFIWGVWLAQNNYAVAHAPDMEVYQASSSQGEKHKVEIWIPITPR